MLRELILTAVGRLNLRRAELIARKMHSRDLWHLKKLQRNCFQFHILTSDGGISNGNILIKGHEEEQRHLHALEEVNCKDWVRDQCQPTAPCFPEKLLGENHAPIPDLCCENWTGKISRKVYGKWQQFGASVSLE
ncbi:uncharacterized protein LOC143672819 [Tamandua tetradactyla]|uniref:uncharacterized protein LOC143672819 n=1 Tax=Tamandua tetradactyla TaxID=48850 RepID=UPI004053DFB2